MLVRVSAEYAAAGWPPDAITRIPSDGSVVFPIPVTRFEQEQTLHSMPADMQSKATVRGHGFTLDFARTVRPWLR